MTNFISAGKKPAVAKKRKTIKQKPLTYENVLKGVHFKRQFACIMSSCVLLLHIRCARVVPQNDVRELQSPLLVGRRLHEDLLQGGDARPAVRQNHPHSRYNRIKGLWCIYDEITKTIDREEKKTDIEIIEWIKENSVKWLEKWCTLTKNFTERIGADIFKNGNTDHVVLQTGSIRQCPLDFIKQWFRKSNFT